MAAWGVLRNDRIDFENIIDENEKSQLIEKHSKHVTHDALSAIKATLAMRYALMKYNKDAKEFTSKNQDLPDSRYMPEIKIGCGLNSGRATVGFMGSKEKMEFTSIGDAVNLASRTESSNKLCCTDILITSDTLRLLKDYVRCKQNNYIIEEENLEDEIIVEKIPVPFTVKGKGNQFFYGVVNMPNFDIKKFFSVTDTEFVLDEDCAVAVGKDGPKSLSELRKILNIGEPDFSSINLDAEEEKVKV